MQYYVKSVTHCGLTIYICNNMVLENICHVTSSHVCPYIHINKRPLYIQSCGSCTLTKMPVKYGTHEPDIRHPRHSETRCDEGRTPSPMSPAIAWRARPAPGTALVGLFAAVWVRGPIRWGIHPWHGSRVFLTPSRLRICRFRSKPWQTVLLNMYTPLPKNKFKILRFQSRNICWMTSMHRLNRIII